MGQFFVVRMRRDLTGEVDPPVPPKGIGLKVLGAKLDIALVKGAHSVLEAGYWEGGGGAPIFRQWWKALRKDYEFDPALVFLAIDGEGVVGMAQCWKSAFVKDLAVHPRARRRGIGSALMLAVFQEFANRGATHVDLRTREDNTNAQALYRSLGMDVVAREPG